MLDFYGSMSVCLYFYDDKLLFIKPNNEIHLSSPWGRIVTIKKTFQFPLLANKKSSFLKSEGRKWRFIWAYELQTAQWPWLGWRKAMMWSLCENLWWWDIPVWFGVAVGSTHYKLVTVVSLQRGMPQEPRALRHLHSNTKAFLRPHGWSKAVTLFPSDSPHSSGARYNSCGKSVMRQLPECRDMTTNRHPFGVVWLIPVQGLGVRDSNGEYDKRVIMLWVTALPSGRGRRFQII